MNTLRNEYIEHLVKRKDPFYWKMLFVFASLVTLFSLFFSLFNLLGILLFIGMAVALYFIWLNMSVEYEYLYIDGEFSVDEVQNRSKRRKLVNIRQSDLIICGPEDSEEIKYNMNGAEKMDVSGSCPPERRYAYIFSARGKKVCMFFELTEELKKEIKYFSPQKFRG